MKNLLLISGSLRAQSYNTALLRAFAAAAEGIATVSWADIHLPLFNAELEADFPSSAEALRQQVLAADAIIISTPEYNRAMTGALKNALDWASRPSGENTWKGKRVQVTSVSPGSLSGAIANLQVRQTLMHCGATVMNREFMVGGAGEKFRDDTLVDEKTKEYVATALDELLAA